MHLRFFIPTTGPSAGKFDRHIKKTLPGFAPPRTNATQGCTKNKNHC